MKTWLLGLRKDMIAIVLLTIQAVEIISFKEFILKTFDALKLLSHKRCLNKIR
jgi:hypothetical protein